MFHPTPHKNSAMVFWPVVRSLHRFCKRSGILELSMSLLSTLNWWVTYSILLDNSTDSSFFLSTPLDYTPYRRMGMSYQVEELVVPALAHVVGSGITVDCVIMYVPNSWWKHMWAVSYDQPDCLILCWILLSKSTTDVS
jgi:hypothetical protein